MNGHTRERIIGILDGIAGDDDRLRRELRAEFEQYERHPEAADSWLERNGQVSHDTAEGRHAFFQGLAFGAVATAEVTIEF